MESFINPYIYAGSVVLKVEVINLVSKSLFLTIEDIFRNSNRREIVDARLIIYYEFKRKGIPVSDIPKITNIPRNRSLMSRSINTYEDRLKYDKKFRNKVREVRNYFNELNIDYENYKLI